MNADALAPELGGNSLFRYSPALVFIAIAIADSQRWADPDLWGHVRFGQAVLAQGHLILRDPYSYSAPGHLWLNHEWLSEVLMAAAYNGFGIIGLKLWKFACSTAIVSFLALGLGETKASTFVQFCILMLAGLALALQLQFRPQLFTYALLSGLLALLARYNYRGHAPLWIAIPMLALWANLHGGFIMGLAALGIFSTVVFAQDLYQGRGIRRALTLFAITGASALATVATPYGIGTWEAVWHALRNPYTRQVVKDWQPMHRTFLAMWHEVPGGTYYIVITIAMFAALAISFVQTPHEDLPMVAIAAVMFAAAVIAIRNLSVSVIATTIPAAHHIELALRARRARLGLRQPIAPKAWPGANQYVVVAAAIAVLGGSGLFSRKLKTDHPYPIGAISFMKEHHLSGNIVPEFGWGEYVIWHLWPQSRVFIDGRYDTVYPREVIKDFLNFQYDQGNAREFLHKYPHDLVLVDPAVEFEFKLMNQQKDWRVIYRDKTCLLYARTNSAAGRLPAVIVSDKDTPQSFFP